MGRLTGSKRCWVPAVLCFLSLGSLAQDGEPGSRAISKELSLLTGIGGSAGFFFDLGLSVNKLDTVPYHSISSACFASVEMHVRDKTVFGPKIGVWAWGGPSPLLMGINLIYYTDLKENCLVLRPEIGVGIGAGHARLKLTYGYNARLVNTSFDRVSRNMFSATYYLKLRSLL